MLASQKQNLKPHKKKTAKTPAKLAFAHHITELRNRVMIVAAVFLVASAVAYQYRDILVSFVLSPLGHEKLVYLTPAGGFSFIFQITMYAGILVAAPILVHQLYRFVVPALPARASRYSVRFFFAATFLMIVGVSFGYIVAIPSALHFLTTFAGTYVEASLTADSYLSFVVGYMLGLGLLFELPLLLIVWNWIKPLGPKDMLSSERFIVLFAFIAAAVITPTPDIFNQSMIALPIIIIYQVGVVAVLIINRRARKANKHPITSFVQPTRVFTPVVTEQAIASLTAVPAHSTLKPVEGYRKPVLSQSSALKPQHSQIHAARPVLRPSHVMSDIAGPVTHHVIKPKTIPAVPIEPKPLFSKQEQPAEVASLPISVSQTMSHHFDDIRLSHAPDRPESKLSIPPARSGHQQRQLVVQPRHFSGRLSLDGMM